MTLKFQPWVSGIPLKKIENTPMLRVFV